MGKVSDRIYRHLHVEVRLTRIPVNPNAIANAFDHLIGKHGVLIGHRCHPFSLRTPRRKVIAVISNAGGLGSQAARTQANLPPIGRKKRKEVSSYSQIDLTLSRTKTISEIRILLRAGGAKEEFFTLVDANNSELLLGKVFGASQIDTRQIGPSQLDIREVSSAQIGVFQVRFRQIGTL